MRRLKLEDPGGGGQGARHMVMNRDGSREDLSSRPTNLWGDDDADTKEAYKGVWHRLTLCLCYKGGLMTVYIATYIPLILIFILPCIGFQQDSAPAVLLMLRGMVPFCPTHRMYGNLADN